MRKIEEILRLRLVGGIIGARRIGLALGCGKTAVAECLRRATAAGLTEWASVEALGETALEQRLYPARSGLRRSRQRPLPDWGRIREELARRDHQVTLALLWTEYKAEHLHRYQYSQFAELYRQYEKRLLVALRQNHAPGERSFVDYCDGIVLTDPVSGEKVPTELFVGALGASSYLLGVNRGQTTFVSTFVSDSRKTWSDPKPPSGL